MDWFLSVCSEQDRAEIRDNWCLNLVTNEDGVELLHFPDNDDGNYYYESIEWIASRLGLDSHDTGHGFPMPDDMKYTMYIGIKIASYDQGELAKQCLYKSGCLLKPNPSNSDRHRLKKILGPLADSAVNIFLPDGCLCCT